MRAAAAPMALSQHGALQKENQLTLWDVLKPLISSHDEKFLKGPRSSTARPRRVPKKRGVVKIAGGQALRSEGLRRVWNRKLGSARFVRRRSVGEPTGMEEECGISDLRAYSLGRMERRRERERREKKSVEGRSPQGIFPSCPPALCPGPIRAGPGRARPHA